MNTNTPPPHKKFKKYSQYTSGFEDNPYPFKVPLKDWTQDPKTNISEITHNDLLGNSFHITKWKFENKTHIML